MKKLQPETQYLIMLEYIQHLVSNNDMTQNALAIKYGVSQSAVYRAIDVICLTIAKAIAQKYRKGLKYPTILKRAMLILPGFVKFDDFSDDMIRMVVTCALYKITPNRDAYINILEHYNLIDFAKSIRGTKANKYAI